MRVKQFVIIVAILLALSVIFLIGPNTQIPSEPKTNKTPSVIGFGPLVLCNATGGNWTAVSAIDYPLNETEGVYNPTTDLSTNYKCFCPTGTTWVVDEGCK